MDLKTINIARNGLLLQEILRTVSTCQNRPTEYYCLSYIFFFIIFLTVEKPIDTNSHTPVSLSLKTYKGQRQALYINATTRGAIIRAHIPRLVNFATMYENKTEQTEEMTHGTVYGSLLKFEI